MSGNQLQKIAESVQDGTLKKLGLDDIFKFTCKQCGNCCINNTIIVNTYDVIRMRHALKMTTCDMIHAGLLSFNIGPDSGMPIATIRFRQINDDLSICPFLAPVYHASSREEIKRRMRNDGIDTAGLTRAKNRYGDDLLLCGINPDKPFRCRAYPLGRISVHRIDAMDITSAEQSWFQVDLPDYCNDPNAQEHTVREWIGSQGMKGYLETSAQCTSMLERIAKADVRSNEDVTTLAFSVLYNFDSMLKDTMADEDTLLFIEKAVDSLLDIADKTLKSSTA